MDKKGIRLAQLEQQRQEWRNRLAAAQRRYEQEVKNGGSAEEIARLQALIDEANRQENLVQEEMSALMTASPKSMLSRDD